MQCHVGQCVTGIATQDPAHETRYKPEVEAQNIHRFFESVRWQIAAITHALGYNDVRQLNHDDLVALTPEAAAEFEEAAVEALGARVEARGSYGSAP